MKTDPADLQRARELRKSMTPQERRLWYDFLRWQPVKYYRQKQIGQYFLDFYCSKCRLAIEIDGSQHYFADGIESDRMRTDFLKAKGIRALRFTNTEIDRNFEGVCTAIKMAEAESALR